MTTAARLLVLAMALALPAASAAQMQMGEQNRLLSITGQVTADQKSAEQVGYDSVSISFSKEPAAKVVWIGVVVATTWNGDAFLGKQTLDQIQGYTPNLLASGKPALLTQLQQAPVGSRVVVEGILDQESRTFLVGMVHVTPPAK